MGAVARQAERGGWQGWQQGAVQNAVRHVQQLPTMLHSCWPAGAKLGYGGKRWGDKGFYLEPTGGVVTTFTCRVV